MPEPVEILKKYWGYEAFRPLQSEIISAVLNGYDVLALLPTGGGKSVCFQVPAMLLDGVCIVISPLIALMKDQVYQLNKRGIGAAAIYSGMTFSEMDIHLDEAVEGKLKFIYVSPERLKTQLFIERLKRMKVSLLAIDEAHCISKWGYDFRPAYLLIHEIKSYLPQSCPIIALTATATELIRKDIVEKLKLKKPQLFVQSFARENLSYSVIETEEKERKTIQILQKIAGTAIVYTKTRKKTIDIAQFLKHHQIEADYYHAGLSLKERNQKQEAWIQNRTRVMVSTNAFGMGIDKADVRVVVHHDLCENMEAYYQESGRAGRDNKKAYAVILYSPADIEQLKTNLALKYPAIPFLKKIYQSLCNYYKIALGTTPTESQNFEIQHFASTFGINAREAHYALKLLENQGLIYLNDAYFNPSKIKIIVNARNIYTFQEKNLPLSDFLKTLLRIYGGEIYAHYINISEIEISQLATLSQKEVIKNLEALHTQKLIDYQPQKSKPQLGFLTARQDAENLKLDYQDIEKRKNLEKAAIKTMHSYVHQKNKCRMLMIQDYFDEATNTKCGVCDNCIKMKKNDVFDDSIHTCFELLKPLLPCSINHLHKSDAFKNKELLIKTIQQKFDTDELGIDPFGLVFQKGS
jgi:ATP-dependent DNA helicase RecQ